MSIKKIIKQTIPKKVLKLKRQFSKVAGYKVNTKFNCMEFPSGLIVKDLFLSLLWLLWLSSTPGSVTGSFVCCKCTQKKKKNSIVILYLSIYPIQYLIANKKISSLEFLSWRSRN